MLPLCGVLLAGQAVAQDVSAGQSLRVIGVGFPRHAFGPWTARIADGGFASATGRSLRWLPHDTDSAVASAFAGGKLDIAIVGASVAVAVAQRGIDVRIFFVAGQSGSSEGLVLVPQKSGMVADPKGLQGKVIATPFGSSAHFRLLQSFRRWGLSLNATRLVNLQTQQITEAWRRGEIDGAAVSEPLLDSLLTRGQPVPLPEQAGSSGLMLMITSSEFAASHAVFLSRFVDVVVRADEAMAKKGLANEDAADAVKSITFITGLPADQIERSMLRYRPPTLAEQASDKWLGGKEQSGLAAELKAIADVLRWSGRMTGNEPDFGALLAPGPVQMALSYK